MRDGEGESTGQQGAVPLSPPVPSYQARSKLEASSSTVSSFPLSSLRPQRTPGTSSPGKSSPGLSRGLCSHLFLLHPSHPFTRAVIPLFFLLVWAFDLRVPRGRWQAAHDLLIPFPARRGMHAVRGCDEMLAAVHYTRGRWQSVVFKFSTVSCRSRGTLWEFSTEPLSRGCPMVAAVHDAVAPVQTPTRR